MEAPLCDAFAFVWREDARLDELVLICPRDGKSPRLDGVLQNALAGIDYAEIDSADGLQPMKHRRILFAVSVWDTGVNPRYYEMLGKIRAGGLFEDCAAALLVDGSGELYTKAIARELVFAANLAGCRFIGRPLVEGTGSLQNFATAARLNGCGLTEAYHLSARELVGRLLGFRTPKKTRPKLLALHASNRRTSNTLCLWDMVKRNLPELEIQEIGLRNGGLRDCNGCEYQTCLHFGERESCFYGGVIVDEVYPAIRSADAVLWVCPNYNDALSANLTACINRLTALFRATPFDRKALFGIVVSGYSGGDLVAQQLISALCMNKAFYLPPRFCALETANDAGAAARLPGVDERMRAFAESIRNEMLPPPGSV